MTKRQRTRLVAMLLACSMLAGCVRGLRTELRDPSVVARVKTTSASTAAPPIKVNAEPRSTVDVALQDNGQTLDLPAAETRTAQIEPLPAPPVRPAPDPTLLRLPDSFTPPEPARTPQLPPPQPPSIPSVSAPPAETKDEPLVEAMRAILANRHELAVQHLKAYGENEEVFLRLLPVLAMMARKPLADISPEESAALNEQLERLAHSLRPRTDLTIKKMCCCEWVKAYGVYKPLSAEHVFLAASRTCPGELVQIYAEIGNISSKKHDNGHVTQLSTSVEIHDRKGNQGYYRRFGGVQPVQTLTPLHDYYNTYSFYVPNNMPPGVYTLTIHVTDETYPERRRTASKSIEFRVSGLPNMPGN